MKKEKKTNNNSSKLIIIIIVCILSLILMVGIGITAYNLGKNSNLPKEEEKETKIQYNTNKEIVEDKEINGILFTNIECSYDGNISLITYTIKNKTEKTINLKEYEVNVKDKDGNIIAIMSPNLDKDIAPGESFDTGNAINIDLTKAYSLELKLD